MSPLWALVDTYVFDETDNVYGCYKMGVLDSVETFLFPQGGQKSNNKLNLEMTGMGMDKPLRYVETLLAALYVAKNLRGGLRSRLTAAQASIAQIMRPSDFREHHHRFVLRQSITSSAHSFATNTLFRAFIVGFRIIYAPPSLGTVRPHLASFVSIILVEFLVAAVDLYNGIP